MSEKVNFKVVGGKTMNCGGCEGRVKAILSQVPGVAGVIADSSTQLIEVTLAQANTRIDDLKTALGAIGYQVAVV